MEKEIVGVGIRMPKSLHKELRKIAFEKEISLNRLLVMGAEWISQKHFEASLPSYSETKDHRIDPFTYDPPPETIEEYKSKRRRWIADKYLESLYKANPHYKGISMKKRTFVNAMFGKKPISYRQLTYLIDIARDYVGFDVDLEGLQGEAKHGND